jgi:cytochrome c-type biogenesis protein CcmF
VTRIIGQTTVVVAFALAIYGLVAAVVAARRQDRALLRSAYAAAYTNFGLLTIANLAMIWALITHDFSIDYVAQVGSRSTPLFFTIISLWSSLEGSILFWGWVLAAYTAAAVRFSAVRMGALGAYASATLFGIGIFFYLLLLRPANPWGVVFPVPADGPGPNPLLQNHPLMAVHPPLLYLGYVGMSVPFAFAVGALLSGRLDDAWLRVTRRWTLSAWAFLSLAIMAGMWWSYDVLGWGGYWAWDPVENASFMPWLTATAFLHSAMVQERRGMLRVWNLSLIVATFLLTILGTFLTLSGVLSSVHAFTEGTIGIYFIAFIALTLLFSLILLLGKSDALHTEGRLDRPLSRETVFLLNNLLFTVFTFTVLLGTLFPLAAEAARGVKVSVGAPFFNRMTVPICVAVLFLIGVGPALPWRGATREQLRTQFLPPLVGLLAGVTLALALGVRDAFAVAAFAFTGFALVTNVQQFVFGAAARRRAHGENPLQALGRLMLSNNRRYGGFVAHIGLILVAIGITGSSVFRIETDPPVTLGQGETVDLGGYTVRFDRVWSRDEPHRVVVGVDLTAFSGDRELGVMQPSLNFYTGRDPVTTPAVRSRPHEDLYVNLISYDPDGQHASISVIVEPLVWWIWVGGIVIAGGAFFSVWPGRRRRRPGRVPPARPVEPVREPVPAGVA